METIFAQATAPGRAGVSIIRISGPKAFDTCKVLCGSVPESRGLRRIVDPQTGLMIDDALVLTFEPGHSFTGEAVVELHTHGSPVVVKTVLNCLAEMDDLSQASPGEFTRRALENGQLDLSQVEGLADLLDAETEAQHRQAIRVFSGSLGQLAEEWRSNLIRAAALLEATIDFADEEVPVDVVPEVTELLTVVTEAMEAQVQGVQAAERIRDGFVVAIVGRPNAGKSTLINYLVGRSAALTSDVPGTTRDVIEVRLDIGGYAVSLLDTAGVRETSDVVESLGVERAIERAEQADVRILLVEDGQAPVMEPREQDIVVIAKDDDGTDERLSVSGRTGAGVTELLGLLQGRFDKMTSGAGDAIRRRHSNAIKRSLESIFKARAMLDDGVSVDMCAAELRTAINAVESIVGRVDVEDLLGEIFQSFCIGK